MGKSERRDTHIYNKIQRLVFDAGREVAPNVLDEIHEFHCKHVGNVSRSLVSKFVIGEIIPHMLASILTR